MTSLSTRIHQRLQNPVPADVLAANPDAEGGLPALFAEAGEVQVERLATEFCNQVRDILGAIPTQDEVQHLWGVWQRKEQRLGVMFGTLLEAGKRAKGRIRTAEVMSA